MSYRDDIKAEARKRATEMKADYETLGSYELVGVKHGVTRQRVAQIMCKYGWGKKRRKSSYRTSAADGTA